MITILCGKNASVEDAVLKDLIEPFEDYNNKWYQNFYPIDDGIPKLSKEEIASKDYITIADIEGCQEFLNEYGKSNCFVVYLETQDKKANNRGYFENATIHITEDLDVSDIATDIFELKECYKDKIQKVNQYRKAFQKDATNTFLYVDFEIDRDSGCWKPVCYNEEAYRQEEEYIESLE